MASTQQRMSSIQAAMDSQLGKPANILIRRGEGDQAKWIQHRGHIKKGKFVAQYEQPITVPSRHDCHPRSEFSMELFGAWLVQESRNPSQDGAAEGVPIQRFDLGDDSTIVIICNEKGEPALQGKVGEWRNEAEIVESTLESQSEENARQ